MKDKPIAGRIVKLTDIERSRTYSRIKRVVPKVFQVLDMWPDAERAMEQDKIGVGEAYVLVIPEELMAKHGFKTVRAVARPIKKLVSSRYKSKYTVMYRRTSEGPTIMICRPKQK